ncbi:M29 family metallopeptidase [Verminephrobacter eiseniae]|uniref:hypothetical protein n=1 Tax=Verminephrobacter eiseniae TaxID=364317 RepID=UPI0010DCAE5A|nr:hypothetical protein [Verminephrobacter eiseniae]KAB7597331.1 hypothetical protein ET532_013185 [Verminephrobacter sp. Larva24]MCW5229944.1 hypothetical protein [Verminephrobacter eiseniae]MCW5291676.1 hypothetical protein [Verminephrobacter eiseniae]MCW8183435.1 hypothetical protein [Verminephrobacter eiseniae]MCW8221702.1 hypothetical protein [Verminephrobacter eiseniae]
MKTIIIDPARIRAFGKPVETHFIVVTNQSLRDDIIIKNSGSYIGYQTMLLESKIPFVELLANQIPNRAHILVISPDAFFQSPPQDSLGNHRKLLAMACNSTPADVDVINHFLRVLEDTDPEKQQQHANHFFELGENAAFLEFVDERNGTLARFNHLDDSYLWSEQAGTLGDGEQQLAPSGEISVLPLKIQEFDETLRLDFNGTIALNGTPILHNGTPSFLRADQQRLHHALSGISDTALIATVENGVIVDLKAASPTGDSATAILQALFTIDSRYRILWEIGFGINTAHRILPGNHAMNETFGNTDGAIHFGLGLTPYTQYHLDIICPNTVVKTDTGEYLIGKRKSAMERHRAAGCPCIE